MKFLHLISDGYSKVSLILELSDDLLIWELIQITKQKHYSLNLDFGNFYIKESRILIRYSQN